MGVMPSSDRSTAPLHALAAFGVMLMLILAMPAAASASVGRVGAAPSVASPISSSPAPPGAGNGVDVPTPTDNVFIPANQNLSDCVGSMELPNCGSPAKGDSRIYLTFAALMLGMGFIGWRISRGVRQRDRSEPTPDHTF